MSWHHEHVIRSANHDDAARIGLVQVRSWQGAYHGLLPQDYLDHLDPARRAEFWKRQISGMSARAGLLVAETGSELTGFAAFCPSRDDDANPDLTGEVSAIYVMPSTWSTGVGRQLMSAAVGRMTANGFTDATLWVLDTNDRARGFYAKAGWAPDGVTKTDESSGFPINEVRYRRSLS